MPTLHWLTRDEDARAASRTPYRLLEAVRDHSAGDPDSGNMLIQGDNLDALKALQPFYSGRVKCIYIDPPLTTPAPRSNTAMRNEGDDFLFGHSLTTPAPRSNTAMSTACPPARWMRG